jgi:hypothetical protein
MRRFRINGWQRIGIVLSLLWVLGVSQWFLRHLPQPDDLGIASIYLQCINEAEADRGVCQNRAEWFSKEARSEFRVAWATIVAAPVITVWLIIYIVIWMVRWIARGFQLSG